MSDTHIGSPFGKAEEDLRRTVADINHLDDAAFVIITGDVPELGTDQQLKTANGVVYCLDPKRQKIARAHKIDNSMVNTVRVIDRRHMVVSTMDGKIGLSESNY